MTAVSSSQVVSAMTALPTFKQLDAVPDRKWLPAVNAFR